ncbi:hypothetical protein BC829DRAFT_259076 [Chytridium lagenaria]|nr:hypothetical protein BC829DRAFT_259076 [Chytridium lagenaria]
MVDSMTKVMDLYGSSQMLLEVEFFDEVGTGLGPTLEFYSTVCREIRRRDGVLCLIGGVGNKTNGGGSVKSNLTAGLATPPGKMEVENERLGIWRDDGVDVSAADVTVDLKTYLNPSGGLFPAPVSAEHLKTDRGRRSLSLFKSLGTFVAKALLDSRIVDMPFSPLFLEMVIGEEDDDRHASIAAHGQTGRLASELHLIKHVDPALYHSLLDLWAFWNEREAVMANTQLTVADRQERLRNFTVRGARLEDLALDFTLPGYPDLELVKDGKNVNVDLENLGTYLEVIVELTVGEGVRKQVDAFRRGFDRVFPVSDLRSFSVQELCVLVGGHQNEDWSLETLLDAIKADHGYTSDSRTIRYLGEMMHGYTDAERRDFLMFVTGSPKLPIGGFKSLSPPLTVVCKNVEEASSSTVASAPLTGTRNKPDDYLPSVMTCVNYLKVPEYSTLEVMKSRFRTAIREGQGCFHLS